MGFEAEHYAGNMHLYAASMDDPFSYMPSFHVNHESKLPWFELNDDLENILCGFSRQARGSMGKETSSSEFGCPS